MVFTSRGRDTSSDAFLICQARFRQLGPEPTQLGIDGRSRWPVVDLRVFPDNVPVAKDWSAAPCSIWCAGTSWTVVGSGRQLDPRVRVSACQPTYLPYLISGGAEAEGGRLAIAGVDSKGEEPQWLGTSELSRVGGERPPELRCPALSCPVLPCRRVSCACAQWPHGPLTRQCGHPPRPP